MAEKVKKKKSSDPRGQRSCKAAPKLSGAGPLPLSRCSQRQMWWKCWRWCWWAPLRPHLSTEKAQTLNTYVIPIISNGKTDRRGFAGIFIPRRKTEDGDQRGNSCGRKADLISFARPGTIGMQHGWLVAPTDVMKGKQQIEKENKTKEVDAHLMLLWFREPSLCWQCFLRCKDSPTRGGAGAGSSEAERHEGGSDF